MKTNLKQKRELLSTSKLHEVVPFQITASSVGPNGVLTVPHLVRLLQEAAMRNTVRLKISSPELIADNGLSWILRRQRIECLRLPEMGELVHVVTAPSGFARSLQTFRDFHLVDESGNTLAAACTQWLLMDIHSRRLRPIPDHIAALAADLAPAAAHLEPPTGKIKAPESPALETASAVAYYQLDFNKHLTNPVFPELMLEPLGADFLSERAPRLIDVDFRSEAHYGDVLTARVEVVDDHNKHALYRGETLLATMETRWQ